VTDDRLTEMPWPGIAKATAVVAAAVGLGLTALSAAALRQQRREEEEAGRVRWTDKNRWE
jgi:hypothetical protein